MLTAFKEQKVLVLRSLDESILSPLLLLIFLPVFGVIGAAIEWALTYTITTILFYRYLIKGHPYLKIHWGDFFIIDKEDKRLCRGVFQESANFLKSIILRAKK